MYWNIYSFVEYFLICFVRSVCSICLLGGRGGDATSVEGMEVEILPNSSLEAAREEQAQKLHKLQQRRLARSIAVPADDQEVRLALRSRGHPVCLFGEDAYDRRERLRALLAEAGVTRLETEEEEQPHAKKEQEVRTEEFYTEGTQQLRDLRTQIAHASLKAAHTRLSRERSKRECMKQWERDELATMQTVRKNSLIASQGGGARPFTAISYCDTEEGDLIVTGDWGGNVAVWKERDGCISQVSKLKGHEERVSITRFHKGILVSAGADSVAVVSEYRDSAFVETARLTGHVGRVADVRVNPVRRSLVATAGFDGDVRLFDTGRALLQQETGHDVVFRLGFHEDGSLLGTAGFDGGIRLWDMRSGRAVMTFAGAHVGDVTALEFCKGMPWMASSGKDNCVRVWDIRKKRCIKTVAAHSKMVAGLAMDRGFVMFSAGFDRCVKAWALHRACGLVASWTGFVDKIMAIDCSGDGRRVVAACYDKTWRVWGSDRTGF
ncbi:U4/U6 small nuclear ribonucleoprotein Prp4 [Gracilariopsis chorda]|uniref:U4/U6 small nuclear ribonucleoprotein Prp4 n=1 Tax=Gracilariopsis chorda TaxID=448386 RepID=A0A2V3ISE6_9FLOR|nr:U4/U6 small nuclear ribonucleoprotein Prp4 [Gracilariopsis chorda]|eukprot:PXF45032.1 U4/U6 small nuclear ribonucleoprotein Prp4 [Gracilariopsis chorda]